MLWLLIVPAVLLSLASLRGEKARKAYVRNALERQPAANPPVTVIVPVKGFEQGLAENLTSLAALDYPDYELIVAARSASDVPKDVVPAVARLVLAGSGDRETGEKINNLLAAIAAARPESEVFAFSDSDGRVQPGWLKALVAALEGERAGAATGYRWHVPEPADFWSLVRSVWNAVIAGEMGPGDNRFAWGGAMAIRRETFYKLHVPVWWKGAVSDDYRLSQAVHAAGLRVVYAPGALAACTGHTGLGELLEWIRRQMMITRFYAPRLWWMALIAHLVYCGAMVAAVLEGSPAALAALALQLVIGMGKSASRVRRARLALPEYQSWFRRHAWAHAALTPLATWLWLYACVAAGVSRTIRWRGYTYRLRRLGDLP